MRKGFTLIETIIYIALLGLIMTGVLTIVFQILTSSSILATHNVVNSEGSFVVRKLNWAFADMSAAPTISGSGCTATMSVTKTGYGSNPVQFRYNSTDKVIEIEQGIGGPTPITTVNVTPTCLTFTPILGTPEGITATLTLSGTTFTTTKYVR